MRSNEEILKGIKDGQASADAMLELWQRNRGLINRCIGHWWDCGIPREDLRQEAYIALVDAVQRYQKKDGQFAFSTVLTYSIRWHFCNMLSKSRYLKEEKQILNAPALEEADSDEMLSLISDDTDTESDTIAELSRVEARRALRAALRRLDADARQLIVYHLVYGYTFATASKLMKTTATKARRTYEAGLRKLRNDHKLIGGLLN